MDKNLKYVILFAVGGVGVYILWKGNYLQQWFPSLFGASPGTAGTGTNAGTSTKQVIPPVMPPATPPPPPSGPTGPAVGTTSIVNGNTFTWNGSSWVLTQAATPPPLVCPPGQYDYNGVCVPIGSSCPAGQTVNPATGKCVIPATVATQLISQQMVSKAGMSDGLNMDQWCYYFSAVTGQDCPFDPGEITPQEFNDAGVVLTDGSPGDRTTPTNIGTWVAFAQLKAPSAGISGLYGLAAMHAANAWLT